MFVNHALYIAGAVAVVAVAVGAAAVAVVADVAAVVGKLTPPPSSVVAVVVVRLPPPPLLLHIGCLNFSQFVLNKFSASQKQIFFLELYTRILK